MNWIEFSKQRPKEEPKRYVLVHWLTENRPAIHLANTDNMHDWPEITHWAEIEPPGTQLPLTPYGHFVKWWEARPRSNHVDCETQHQTAREAFEAGWMVDKKQPPPTPDPFEEWLWDRKYHIEFNAAEIAAAREGWDAALAWGRSRKNSRLGRSHQARHGKYMKTDRSVLTDEITPTTFPERIAGWKEPEFPALIKPWLDGVRAYWYPDLQAFYLFDTQSLVRVTGIEPVSDDIVLGEFYEKDHTQDGTLRSILSGRTRRDLTFTIFDVAHTDEDALTRAAWCQSLPYQAERGTLIAQMFQVGKESSFNQWLKQWRMSRFAGALAVPYQAPWLSSEHEVALPL